jgi:hypothetical protein
VSEPSPKRRAALIALGLTGAAAVTWGVADLVGKRNERERRRAKQAERANLVQSIQRVDTEGMIGRLGLAGFLAFWNDNVLARLRSAKFPLDRVQAEILESGTIFLPPATQSALAALEAKLGERLPPSFHAFYSLSNGAKGIIEYAQADADLLPVEKIDWLHVMDRQLVDIWTKERLHPADGVYFQYGKGQDTVQIRTDYMKRAIAFSPVVDGGVYLLVPQVAQPDGEIEVWDFSVKHPGAIRYRSLNGLLEAHCSGACWNLEYWSLSHGWKRDD